MVVRCIFRDFCCVMLMLNMIVLLISVIGLLLFEGIKLIMLYCCFVKLNCDNNVIFISIYYFFYCKYLNLFLKDFLCNNGCEVVKLRIVYFLCIGCSKF